MLGRAVRMQKVLARLEREGQDGAAKHRPDHSGCGHLGNPGNETTRTEAGAPAWP